VDDLALATVVPGVRVRVPPRRQLSHHERPLTDDVRMAQSGGSWMAADADARSRANVERWLCDSRDADTARVCSSLSRQQRHRHSVQRASHARNGRPRAWEAPDQSRMERSMSETDVRRPTAAATAHFRSRDPDHFRRRDQHRTTPNRSSVPGTPSSAAGSVGAGEEAESRLGPSLVQLVAEIIEGLEQRSRDDSSAVWSGIRGPGTPASKIFQQLTTRVRNTDLVGRTTVEDQRTEDTAGLKGTAETSGYTLTQHDKTRCVHHRNELPVTTYFEEKQIIRHHDTRHKHDFHTHIEHTEFGKRSIKKGCKLWTNLHLLILKP